MPYRHYTSDEIIALRSKPLSGDELRRVEFYLNSTPRPPKEGYIQELYDLTLSQLIIKAGYNIRTYPGNVPKEAVARLELLADRLNTHFLKRKLGRVKNPKQFTFSAGSEILDPHHHLNSIYVKDYPQLLNLLPDFNAIYVALRNLTLNSKRERELYTSPGILTDTQFLGRAPTYQSEIPRVNKTVGYVRGPEASNSFKEGFISGHARQHNNICRSCDMCGPETNDSSEDIERYINHVFRHQAEIIRIHIGETHIPLQGKANVDLLFKLLDLKRQQGKLTHQTIRLGHGTHMGIAAMLQCSQYGYYVEACLSSNKETGIIAKRKEYPLGLMLLLGVNVMIGTDGGDAYYTDLKTEYAHAEQVLQHFLNKIKEGHYEVVRVPNGDELQYHHVKEFFIGIPQSHSWDDDKVLTYSDLKLIEHLCLQKITMQKLLDNMNEFKEKMFPTTSDKKEVKPLPSPSPSLSFVDALTCILDQYIKDRSNLGVKYKTTFFCMGFGYSKDEKIAAATALKDALEGNTVDLSSHLGALRNGILGKKIRDLIKNNDTSSFLEKDVNTVSALVKKLSNNPMNQIRKSL